MRPRRVLRSAGFAAVAAVVLGTGVLAGGTAYQTTHPSYDRIVWMERDPQDPAGDRVVQRALYSDGRFLALTATGYQAGIVPAATTDEIFATVETSGLDWHSTYRSAARLGELVDLQLDGQSSRSIEIANPQTNVGLPTALNRVLLLFTSADRQTSLLAFTPASVRFHAAKAADTGGSAVEDLPTGFPLDAAASSDGVAIGGANLALLEQVWPEVTQHLGVGIAHRVVSVGTSLWRISWTLDLDAVGSKR
jgi:hypothetical protein